MIFTSNDPVEMECYNRYVEGIQKGVYTFNDVGSLKWKQSIVEQLLPDVQAGTATEHTVSAFANYYARQINRKKMAINDVPDCLKSKVQEVLEG